VTAALSCANSGMYGAARSLYGLAREGLAPAWLGDTSSRGIPLGATILTVAASFAFLPFYRLFEGTTFYTWLLSVSGFTGALCWISISICQLMLRKRVSASRLTYTMPGYPWLSWTSIGLQLLCLACLALHPTLRSALVLGVPAFAIPALLVRGTGAKRSPRGAVPAPKTP
jgi:AAT family amino acid transporter